MTAEPLASAQARARIALAVSLIMAGAAAAQAPADEEISISEVVVTGTRIVSPNMTSTSPVQVITAEELREGGRADISDVLSNLPQIQNNYLGQGLGNRSSGLSSAGGVANIDLRGLGPNRTLVLVNGRRLGVGSPNTAIASPSPDIDQIPTALIERIDVVTGGASATYGSDAIAGVVNFVTKRDFQGLELDYQVGWNWHNNNNPTAQRLVSEGGFTAPSGSTNDGRQVAISAVFGTSLDDGRGNVTAFLGYLTQDPVRSSDRDFGACQLFANDDLDGAVCGGSANSNYFRGLNNEEYQVVGDQFAPWGSSEASVPPATYNSQSLIYMNRNNQRYNAGFLAHYDVSDQVRPYAEFSFMNDRTNQEIAPSGLFRDSNPLTASGHYLVNCSNPLLSAQQRSLLCTPADVAADLLDPGSVSADVRIGRRNVEGGGRASNYEHTNYRAVFGFRGDINPVFSYDAYGQYYYTSFFQSDDNYLNFQSIANALQVTGTAAAPECISGGACVPYNIFREGAVTNEQLQYLYTPGTARGTTTLRTVHADVTAQLGEYGIKLPWHSEGVGVNVGYEHRNEHLYYAPDGAKLSGLLAGAGGAAVGIDNAVSVEEQFIEVRVPLLQGMKGVHDLVFDTGYRRSDYSTSDDTVDTYKFELQYAPVADMRFRGSYQRAIRAPSIIELYSPQNVGQVSIGTDPCAPTRDSGNNIIAAAATLAQCQLSGVTPAQYGNGGSSNTIPQGTASQLTQNQGGNPDLDPEVSDSYTLGVTFTPSFLPGFSGSLDYFNIKIEDQIGTLPPNTIIQGCVFQGDPFYCSQLVRSPVTGGLTGASVASGGYIVQTNVNVAAAKTEGLDLQTTYRYEMPVGGSLNFYLSGSYLLKNETTPQPGSPTYDCAGLFGPTCQLIGAKWRHTAKVAWNTPFDWQFAVAWRYLGSSDLDNNDSDPTLNGSAYGAPMSFNARLPAYSWIDLTANWDFMDNVQIRAGINNVLDKDPPIVVSDLISGGAANTYESYDLFGRQIFAGITIKL